MNILQNIMMVVLVIPHYAEGGVKYIVKIVGFLFHLAPVIHAMAWEGGPGKDGYNFIKSMMNYARK